MNDHIHPVMRDALDGFARTVTAGAPAVAKPAPCKCPAYSFPHREGAGQCFVGRADVCEQCGKPCTVVTVDHGIGWTEFWGQRAYHSRKEDASSCCHAGVL